MRNRDPLHSMSFLHSQIDHTIYCPSLWLANYDKMMKNKMNSKRNDYNYAKMAFSTS